MNHHIKAFIFDFGGVLSLPMDANCLKEMAAMCGVTIPEFRAAYGKERLKLDRGDTDVHTYYSRILDELGKKRESAPDNGAIGRLLELDTQAWATVNGAMEAWVRKLKAAGYPLGILSNMPAYFLPKLKERVPVFSLFHSEVFSCDVRLVKPEPAIYFKALDALCAASGQRFTPEEVIYIDDMEVNALAARELKFAALLYRDLDQLRKELPFYGVSVLP